jgi:hypothetical protein
MHDPTAPEIIQLYDSFQKNMSLRKLLQQNMFQKKVELWFDKYQIRKYLGEGACATVLKAINKET